METKIWVYGKPMYIKPTDTIRTTRRLTSFCVFNCIRNALFKSQGGWYWLQKDGKMRFIDRCLDNVTFEELFNLRQE